MKRRWLAAVPVLALALFLAWPTPPPPDGELSLQNLMGPRTQTAGYRHARQGVALRFPADHLQHPGYRNEWWYLTGQLESATGEERFGFQLTLFRFALAPPAAPEDAAKGATEGAAQSNPWLSPQIYMAHLGVSNLTAGEHRAAERFSRPGPGLAGSDGLPVRVWLGDWRIEAQETAALFPLVLTARDRAQRIGLQLNLAARKPRVLQGDAGYSLKNSQGGASFYYSYTRLETTGTLAWNGREIPVTGSAWYDHEWSSNSLAPHQAGWDWFSLQLEDGRELMVYRFRRRDGGIGRQHLGLIDGQGNLEQLDTAGLRLESLGRWRSPDGTDYPSGWRLQVPEQGLDLVVEPLLADQEMRLSVRYWEGAVRVSGSHSGRGYVELTGYGRGD
jgi:predicted secreted hydrolase